MNEEEDKKRNAEALSVGLGSLPLTALSARLVQATQGFKTGSGKPAPLTTLSPQDIFNLIQQLIDQEIQQFIQGLITAAQLAANIASIITHDFIASLGFIDSLAIQGFNFVKADALAAYATLGAIDAKIASAVPPLITQAIASIPAAAALTISQVDSEVLTVLKSLGIDPAVLNASLVAVNNAIRTVNSYLSKIPGAPSIPTVTIGPWPPSGYTVIGGPYNTQADANNANFGAIAGNIVRQNPNDGKWYILTLPITGGRH